MRIAILATDNREHHRRYELANPYFGPAVEAVLEGLSGKTDVEIHVVSCTQKPMQSREKLAGNTWFHLLHVPKIGWLRTGYQGCIRAIRQKLRKIQPDIAHGQGTERDCAISAVFSGFPNVVTIHGNMRSIARTTRAKPFSYSWCAARLETFTLPKTCGVICNSAYTQSIVQPRARRIWRVPNAVRREFFDTPLPATSPTSKPVLLNIGTIAPHKRQLDLLEVAGELHREDHSFELQFIGAADSRNKYAATFLRRIEAVERAGFAHYLGTKSLSELIASLDSASALVHVPSAESFGLVVAEALARNLKFFGTNVGGLRDIANNVEGADLFPLEDRTALSSAIAQWLRSGCPRPESATHEMRRRYHPEVVAQRHVQIYKEILS